MYHKFTYICMLSIRYFFNIIFETWIFFADFRKSSQIYNYMKFPKVSSEFFFFQTATTDETKNRFRNFVY